MDVEKGGFEGTKELKISPIFQSVSERRKNSGFFGNTWAEAPAD
jgi:hypothetical protein